MDDLSRREFIKLIMTASAGGMVSITGLDKWLNVDEDKTIAYFNDISASVIPGSALVQSWNTQQIVIAIGSSGMTVGSSLKIQFPKSWHNTLGLNTGPSGMESYVNHDGCQLDHTRPFPLHTERREGQDYFITATTTREGSNINLSVSHSSIDGLRQDNLDWTATLILEGEDLVEGDLIIYTFGDTSNGGSGVLSGRKAEVQDIRLAFSESGGTFLELPSLSLESIPGPVVKFSIVVPMFVEMDEKFDVIVLAKDEYDNCAVDYRGLVDIFATTEFIDNLPAYYKFKSSDNGRKIFRNVALTTLGAQWLDVVDNQDSTLFGRSNPVDCRNVAPSKNIYWGDLHVHTDFSKDGRGKPAGAYSFARSFSCLDFVATTEHSYTHSYQYTDQEWRKVRKTIDSNYIPGSFVTILGYEWTVWTPYGHRHVIFPHLRGKKMEAVDYPTVDELWAALDSIDADALAIPHHTGEQWRQDGNSAAVDWSYANSRYQRNIEIYSSDGQCEYYDPSHPLSYENIRNYTSVDGPHYARDAWAIGQRLGVLASSDNHAAMPGRPHLGLTAVYAEDLTRKGIFKAINSRHTYATTGERIILEFTIDGNLMGDEFSVSLPYKPAVNVRVVGTDDIAFVELVKYDGDEYHVVYDLTDTGTREVSFTFEDTDFTKESLYYVRLQQVNEVGGRIVMAWSSPIWITPVNM